MHQMTLNVSETTFQRVASLATLTKQSIDELAEKAFENSFAKEAGMLEKSIKASSDKEVLTLAKMKISAKQNRRLSFLLEKNGEGTLTPKEEKELGEMILFCQIADLRKAIGIAEALRRGLIKSAKELP